MANPVLNTVVPNTTLESAPVDKPATIIVVEEKPAVTTVVQEMKAVTETVVPTPSRVGSNAWFKQQFALSALLKAGITLSILGFIPGAWMVGLPLLTIYGLMKRETVAEGIRRFFSFRKDSQTADVPQNLGEKTADFLITYYAGILRWFATFMLFFTMPIGFGIFAAYGLFRFTTNEWLDIFQKRCSDIYQFVISSINRFVRDASFQSKMILGGTVAVLLGASILMSGVGILLAYSISVCQLAAVLVGATAVIRDLKYAVQNPGIVLTQHSGKIAGTFWGRWLAYRIFPGQITGSMGPAVGHVQSYGLFSGIFSSFLAPEGWFIFNSGGIFGVMLSRFMTFFNSIFTNIFVSESIQMQGDFYGIIGPSPLQLIGMMLVGCLVGFAVEKFVDSLYNEVTTDTKKVATASVNNIKVANERMLQSLYRTRWALGFIIGTTPLMLAHGASQAMLLSMAGGSMVGAAAIAVAGLATTLGVIYGIGLGVKGLANKIRAKSAQVSASQTLTKPVDKTVKVEDKQEKTVAPIVTAFTTEKARTKQAPIMETEKPRGKQAPETKKPRTKQAPTDSGSPRRSPRIAELNMLKAL